MFDAHCHTDCSDGNISIEERCRLIRELGYEAATITDHDFVSTELIQRARAACSGIPFVPGVELSLAQDGKVVHLLGYFINPEDESLQQHFARVQAHDRQITGLVLEAFQRACHTEKQLDFDLSDLEADSLHTFYSMQLVRRLAATVYVDHPKTLLPAFLHHLDDLGLTYADLAPWPVRNAVDLIHAAGGIAVLAHPGGRTDQVMQTLGFLWHDEPFIQMYAEWGLDGIETRTPVHTDAEQHYYEELSSRHNLLATSGSDCHGDDPYLGPALMGHFQNLYDGLYKDMLQAVEKRHS